MRGCSPLRQETKPKPRKGEVYVSERDAEYPMMSDKPMHEGQDPSSHLMADDGNKTAWPTLFQVDGVWYDTRNESTEKQKEIAKQQNEIYKFNTKEEMIDFARKGNWKNK